MTRVVVVPGNHDGVHVGHQRLIARARSEGDRVIALTFWPHPLALLRPERAPKLIASLDRRRELLVRAGAEVHVAAFDASYAAQSAEVWVTERLRGELGASAIVVGPDYRFGKDRAGTPELLTTLGLQVIVEDAVTVDGEPASSTRVRSALETGDVALATRLLGRTHDVDGVVIEGQKRGRTIGFPTANLGSIEGMTPADGVYAVAVRTSGGARLEGVANVGVRPTVGAGRSVEAHLFDWSGDLYGQRLRLAFVARLRAEQKFDSVDALVAQIGRDAAQARHALAAADKATFP